MPTLSTMREALLCQNLASGSGRVAFTGGLFNNGTVAVQATTQNKAKVLASSIYPCPWVSQTVEAA